MHVYGHTMGDLFARCSPGGGTWAGPDARCPGLPVQLRMRLAGLRAGGRPAGHRITAPIRGHAGHGALRITHRVAGHVTDVLRLCYAHPGIGVLR